MRLKTIDAHVAGAPLRLIVEGFPSPSGSTMAEKREWASARAENLRRAAMCEPRGHRDMAGAVLTEPVDRSAAAGVLFMDADGYRDFSALGAMAVSAIAVRHQLIVPPDDRLIVLDTAAGPVRAQVAVSKNDEATAEVTLDSAPAFVLQAGVPVAAAGRRFRADVAASGVCYAVVDSESAGVPLDMAHLCEIRKVGSAITDAVNNTVRLVHPLTGATSVAGTIVTSPAHYEPAAIRHVLVAAHGAVGRAPSGSGAGAVLAVLDAMGLVSDGQPLVCEGLSGLTLTVETTGRRQVGDYPAVSVRLHGRVCTTGEHTFVMSADDPLRYGFI